MTLSTNHRLALLMALFVGCYQSYAQTPAERVGHRFLEYRQQVPQEKIYAHLDKPYYSVGDTLWFKIYLVDAYTHLRDTLSKNIYVDFIRKDHGKVLRHSILRNEDGIAKGRFILSDSVQEGAFELSAYTSWMKNFPQGFYQKEVLVYRATRPVREAEIVTGPEAAVADLQFFPEGGNLVAGLQNRIAFKAVNQMGKGVSVRIQVVSERGDTVAAADSQHLGMGRFILVPRPNEKYHAVIRGLKPSTKFLLPEVEPNGCTLYVDNFSNKEFIQVIVRNNFADQDKPILIVRQRGSLVASFQSNNDGNAFSFLIPRADIPDDGIVQFSVFSRKGDPLCERLVFHDSGEPLGISLEPNQKVYHAREQVTVRLVVKDFDGDPVRGNFSVAVTDQEQVHRDPSAENIRTYFHLSSEVQSARKMLGDELRGGIEEPGYYFSSEDLSKKHLDLLLMTQGWRRFSVKEVLSRDSVPFVHPVESGLGLSGKALLSTGKPSSKPMNITLIVNLHNETEYRVTTTNPKGEFAFLGMDIQDSLKAFVQGRKERGGKDVNFTFDAPSSWEYPRVAYPVDPLLFTTDPSLQVALKAFWEGMKNMASEKTQMLKTVEVSAKRDKPDPRKSLYSGDFQTVKVDKVNCGTATSFMQLLQTRVAGLTLVGMPPNQTVMIRGSAPDIVVDGVTYPLDYVKTMWPCDFESIDVFKHPVPGLGTGARTLISILTKFRNPNFDWSAADAPGAKVVTLHGYDTPREFYSPKYDLKANEAPPNTDYRSTVYWNPDVKTDERGMATMVFWNSDAHTTVHLQLEGIAEDGKPAVASATYTVME